eukprot:173110-Amphidinium_carterae.1
MAWQTHRRQSFRKCAKYQCAFLHWRYGNPDGPVSPKVALCNSVELALAGTGGTSILATTNAQTNRLQRIDVHS